MELMGNVHTQKTMIYAMMGIYVLQIIVQRRVVNMIRLFVVAVIIAQKWIANHLSVV
jgi:hypothetical protein